MNNSITIVKHQPQHTNYIMFRYPNGVTKLLFRAEQLRGICKSLYGTDSKELMTSCSKSYRTLEVNSTDLHLVVQHNFTLQFLTWTYQPEA